MAVWQALTEEGTTYTVNKTFTQMTPKERADIERYMAQNPTAPPPGTTPAGPQPDNTLTPGVRGGQPIEPSGGSGSPGDQSIPPQVRGGQPINPSRTPGGGAPPPTASINDPNKPFNSFDPSLENAFGQTPVGPTGRSTAPGTPNEADTNKLPPGVLKAVTRPGPEPVPGSQAPGDKWWPDPSSGLYDQYVINKLLQDYGMNGWTGADRPPIEIMKEGKTEYGEATGQMVGSGTFILNVRGPDGEIRALKIAKVSNPQNAKAYGWGLLDSAVTVAAPDAGKKGHSGLMTIGRKIYGTNNVTGAFELVPGAPDLPEEVKNWGTPYQIDDGQGNKVWYGTNPATGRPEPIPNMPATRVVQGYDNPQWVREGNQLVYKGWNQKTGQYELVPGIGPQPLPDKPPLTTPGGGIYTQNPDGTYTPAAGVEQPRPGMTQYVPDPDQKGFHKKQIYSPAGIWTDAVDDPDYHKATSDLAKAQRPKGEKYWIIHPSFPDRQIEVESDGAGGYTIPPNAQVRRIPGLQDSVASASGDQEFQTRWNPDTQKYEQYKNPNWTPKGTGDQVRQLRELAEQKRAELHAKIGKNGYTAEQAEQDFNAYWDSHILPRQQQIEFDQRKEIEDRDRLNQAQRAQNLTAASGIGQGMAGLANTFNQQSASPTYANYVKDFVSNVGAGKAGTEIRTEDFMKPTYDLQEVAQYYMAQALKGISPTADAIAGGMGTPAALQSASRGVDVASAIGGRQFNLPGAGGGPPPATGGGTTIQINTAPGGAPAAATAQPISGAGAAPTAPGTNLGTFPIGQQWNPNLPLGGFQWPT